MSIILLNGSPRGDRSNSKVMLKWLIEGYGKELEIYNLNTEAKHAKAIAACLESDTIYLMVPLYFNSMPGQVMKFFESLSKYKPELEGKSIGFFIHSGFPEGQQSYELRAILENIARKLNLNTLTTVIRGGSEPTRLMPESWQKRDKDAIVDIGKALRLGNDTPSSSYKRLVQPVKLSALSQVSIKLGSINVYWRHELRKNGALKKSFDRPYLEQ